MSEKYTSVETPSGCLGLWGHVEREDAIEQLRRFYQHEMDAQRVLARIEAGEVRVFHQRGVYAPKNRHEVLS